MKLRRAKPKTPQPGTGQSNDRPKGKRLPARLRKAEKELATLRRRMAELENEVQEARHLNKRLAEIADVVAEVLLPAEQRDEDRLREVLARYDSTL